ncbi:MAG: YdcF family protein [Thermotogota bacterium]|nr:YdcF family protein [Thermotogota bacterium]
MPNFEKSDAIVVLSAAQYSDEIFDRSTYQRLMHGFKLYDQNYAGQIIVCGGNMIKGSNSIAESMKNLLVEMGVDENKVIIEAASQNTYESILNIKPLLSKFRINRIILVTSSYHMFRSMAICNKLGITVQPAPVFCYEKNISAFTIKSRFIFEILREYGAIIYFWLRGWI